MHFPPYEQQEQTSMEIFLYGRRDSHLYGKLGLTINTDDEATAMATNKIVPPDDSIKAKIKSDYPDAKILSLVDGNDGRKVAIVARGARHWMVVFDGLDVERSVRVGVLE